MQIYFPIVYSQPGMLLSKGVRTSVATSLALCFMAAPLLAQSDVDALITEVLEESSDDTPAAPSSPAAPPTLQPQTRQPRHPGTVSGNTVSNIQFPNSDVRHVLAFYEQLTGKQAIYDNTVQGQINIVVNQPLSREEAIQIIETALQMNGFTLIPGPGERIVKVAGTQKNARQFAVPIYSDVADLPEGDQIVSFLFRLDYAEPTEVQQTITQYIANSPSYTAIIPLPKAQALLITETAPVLRMVGKLIDAIDQPPAEVVSEFITLERADAKEVVEKLTATFEKTDDKTGTQSPQMPFMPPWAMPPGGPNNNGQGGPATQNAQGGGITLSEDSLIIGKIKITADERTNRIHVVTRPANIAFIRRLIAEYDANVSYGAPATYTLRYVAAAEIIDALVTTIAEPGMKTEEGTAGSSGSSPRSGSTGSSGGGGGNSSSGVALGAEELSVSSNIRDLDTIPVARTVGNTRIIADKRTNSIIVLGSESAKQKVFRVLDEIDVRSPQVMLTAVIGELTLDEGEEFGVDYIYKLGRTRSTTVTNSDGTTTVTTIRPDQAFAGISRNTSLSLTDLATLTSVSAFTGMPAGTTALIGATDSLDILVTALESSGKFRITSRPMVFTSNNKKAIITSGQQIAVPMSTTSGFTGGSDNLVTTSNIQYKDVVLKLEVVPLINSDREVTLDIVQEVNSVNGSTEISGNIVPTINARKIKTTISVANEATIALGGLVQESKEFSNSGIPILHQLPLVGPLFGTKREQKKRTELIVLLRPTVTYDPMESSLMTEREQEKLSFPPDLEASIDAPAKKINANPPAAPVKPARPTAPERPRSATRH